MYSSLLLVPLLFFVLFLSSFFFFFFLMIRRPPRSTLFPTRRSSDLNSPNGCFSKIARTCAALSGRHFRRMSSRTSRNNGAGSDRKSTRLNSSHGYISYAVFCLKKKKKKNTKKNNIKIETNTNKQHT